MLTFNEHSHEYFYGGIRVPSVSQLMEPILSKWKIDPFYAERGTAVHTLTEAIDTGNYFPELAGDLYPWVDAYMQFHDAHDVEVLEMEKMVFHPRLLYAGRMDRLWNIDGDYHLTDIKTGGKYRQHRIQLTAYAMAYGGDMKISNLYLNPYDYKFHEWEDDACELVEALSLVYWETRVRDRARLEKLLEAPDENK